MSVSAADWIASDDQLAPFRGDGAAKYLTLPGAAVVEAAKKGLEGSGYKVSVVPRGADALEVLKSLAGADKTYGQAGSTTLEQIGWTTFLKETPAAFKRNFKAESLAAQAKGDWAAAGAASAAANTADVFVSSAVAVSQDGGIVAVDLTGTRTGPFITAQNLVIIVSANKIVPTVAEANARADDWALPVESARVRVAYKAMGVTASAIKNRVVLTGSNPFGAPHRVHVVIVTDEVLGF